MYIDKPFDEYLNDLAGRKPVPGGGSAASLVAAIGTCLISMVANYTIGNPKYKDAEARVADILIKAEKFREELLSLIDKDVEAYSKVSKAKSDAAYKDAAEPPFQVCRITSQCLRLCADLVECGNKNLITDTAIAAIMLEGAFFSAKFNVYINLKYIKDMNYIESVHKAIARFSEEIPRLKKEILEKCENMSK